MQSNPMTQLVQLAPTNVFFAFLLSQLGKDKLPDRNLLNIDTTLYRIPYLHTTDETLDYIEARFSQMFSYELKRWLGADVTHEITSRFDDFILCFELKVHTYVYASQPLEKDVIALGVKPSSKMLVELSKLVEKNSSKLTQNAIDENHTIVLLNQSVINSLKPFVEENYEMITSLEKKRLELFEFEELLAGKSGLFSFSLHQHVTDVANDENALASLYRKKRTLDLMFDKG